jgi:hypothetical protein
MKTLVMTFGQRLVPKHLVNFGGGKSVHEDHGVSLDDLHGEIEVVVDQAHGLIENSFKLAPGFLLNDQSLAQDEPSLVVRHSIVQIERVNQAENAEEERD